MKLLKISVLVLALVLIMSMVNNSDVEASEETETVIRPTIEKTPSLLLSKEAISVEYNEVINFEDYVLAGYFDQVEVPLLDTTQLGTHTVYYIAKTGLNEVQAALQVTINDTVAPIFDKKISTLTLDYGEEVDLNEWFEVSDNTPGEVTLTFSDEIDSTIEGTHNLTALAVDESGNEATHEFEVIVKPKPKPKPIPVYVPPVVSTPSTSDTVAASSEAFSARVTYYGVDCYGCYMNSSGQGSLASGVRVSTSAVYQNGSWVPGITYKGYYILAAGKQYPFCTVIDLYNHTISGNGISPSQPIRGIVLDRGGAVSGNHFDVFIGSQKSSGVRHVGGSPKAEVVGFVSGCY